MTKKIKKELLTELHNKMSDYSDAEYRANFLSEARLLLSSQNKRKIYLHGTDKKNAKKILANGFKKGTWFADHLEDALACGGNHIFQVAIKWEGERHYNWQILSANKISKKQIVNYSVYKKPKLVFENKKLREAIFNQNL